jgi:deoxyribodipyrimidine photolyase-related protein
MRALLVFPHQLFASNAQLATTVERVCLIEDPLFFLQYRFHKQKLVLHRASMQFHADYLRQRGSIVDYVDFNSAPTMDYVFGTLVGLGIDIVHYIDVVDDWLLRRITKAGLKQRVSLVRHESPMFLSDTSLLHAHFSTHGDVRMANFYADQRRQKNILMDSGRPVGGRWSFDEDNRKRLPRNHPVPSFDPVPADAYLDEAKEYVNANFAQNPGDIDPFVYPTNYVDANSWLLNFVKHRLPEFGPYEDAISLKHDVLFHSLLSPSMNIGLLTPTQVIDAAISQQGRVPLNSLEGFIRQVVGWREYMRGAYLSTGRRQRTRNYWNHSRPIPSAFWSGETSITPVDAVIRKLVRCAYAHHIERLMVLSNFMLLCEFHPDDVYRWFMEMFIDSYDWVMVPNVYGMALYADGGGITTKPYISGSNYLLKMSDIPKGPWCAVWDALYWRFIAKHREQFLANRRTQVLVMGLERLSSTKRSLHFETAENFLGSLGA